MRRTPNPDLQNQSHFALLLVVSAPLPVPPHFVNAKKKFTPPGFPMAPRATVRISGFCKMTIKFTRPESSFGAVGNLTQKGMAVAKPAQLAKP